MSGVDRTERSRTTKFYERKVHFEELPAATPVKPSVSFLVPGAESHKHRKRKSVSEARRRSTPSFAEEVNAFLRETSDPWPKTPVRKTRAARRITTDVDMIFKAYPPDSSTKGFSSPCGKMIGMPDITDFEEGPDYLFPLRGTPYPSKDSYLSHTASFEKLPSVGKKSCLCDRLRERNNDLRRKYGALNQKYQLALKRMSEMRTQLAMNGIVIPDDMMCDAEDEYGFSRSSTGSSQRSPGIAGTPALSRSSAYSTPSTVSLSSPVIGDLQASPAIAEFGTPASSGLPNRVIDEDYDEGYEAPASESYAGMSEKLSADSGLSMEETINELADDVSTRWRIDDNGDISMGGLVMPSMPRFNF